MSRTYLHPGQQLWYCNRKTGELGTVKVTTVYSDIFFIEFRGKIYRLPTSALGTRLFFTRNGAARPSEIIKDGQLEKPYFWDHEIQILCDDDDPEAALQSRYGPMDYD